jgi:hypothetical protein
LKVNYVSEDGLVTETFKKDEWNETPKGFGGFCIIVDGKEDKIKMESFRYL